MLTLPSQLSLQGQSNNEVTTSITFRLKIFRLFSNAVMINSRAPFIMHCTTKSLFLEQTCNAWTAKLRTGKYQQKKSSVALHLE